MIHYLIGDARTQLETLRDHSVHCVVTSPPYWGLRSYLPKGSVEEASEIGKESTPQAFIANLVAVFREVRRVMRPDATLWLNMGDCYTDGGRGDDTNSTLQGSRTNQAESRNAGARRGTRPFGLGPKQLLMMPARLAIAMQEDGWILRSDIVWHKVNPMPESVSDRPTKAHESLFLFSPSPRYFYDREAIAEPLSQGTIDRITQPGLADQAGSDRAHAGGKTNGTMKAVVRKSGNKARKSGADRGCQENHRANVSGSVPWASDGSHRRQFARAMEIAIAGGLTEAHLEAIRLTGIRDTDRSTTIHGRPTISPKTLRLAAEAKEVLGAYFREFLGLPLRNRRSVWTIATVPFKCAHFATFPPGLVEPCILAGTSRVGCCPACGAQWRRQIERTDVVDPSANGSRFDKGKTGASERAGDRTQRGERYLKQTVGWEPSCGCLVNAEPPAPIPCTVLDPFAGSGTTGLVADRLGRSAILIDLNPANESMMRERISSEAPLFHDHS